ncbi:acetyl-CoA synthetase-like protein [Parathielavia appendiculata]|uniref:Acetyl-CoA synthetase-like protein n=1 Tax=Parathielavia appendiculata TaxID=2587402 RepID=A0AAN6TSH2_9PEZI|nr:acetyl-CoA synthetase-like protein [Parathielavia appendiculata]
MADVDDATRTEIAQACGVPPSMIEDAYTCTPLQLSMIAEDRAEIFHFVMSFGPSADIDRFCDCLRAVVAANAILRTRLVRSARLGGIVQVVTTEQHVTTRHDDGTGEHLERYLEQAHLKMGLGDPLIRSAFIGRNLVLTLHHAVFDYWSWDTLMKVDIPVLYFQQQNEAHRRPAFKDFVARCLNIDDEAASRFWASRFKGSPAVFLGSSSRRVLPPHVVAKRDWKFPLVRIKSKALPPTHAPYFIEAAWALVAAIDTDSESVAYGYVLSGRTPTPDGLENTLGPAITEAPIQANLPWKTMTVDKLIKDRAASVRQLQQNPHLIHYPLEKIAVLSEAARTACGFRALLNIRPAVFDDTDSQADVRMERMVWLNGFFALQLIFSITGEGVEVWPRVDSTVIDDRRLERLLQQFGHTLRLLTEVSPQTKLDSLPLLDPKAREEVLQLNKTIPEPVWTRLDELFAARVRVQPSAMAIESSQGNASYAQLDQLSLNLALVLQSRGVTTESRVGFVMDKSLWAVVAFLAVLRLGGVCVPVDNNLSEDARVALLSATGTRLVLVPESLSKFAPGMMRALGVFEVVEVGPGTVSQVPLGDRQQAHARNGNIARKLDEALAFIVPTSNPASKQKAALLGHRNLASALTSQAQRFGWGPDSRVLQFWSCGSGNGLLEIFGALVFGGCLCISPNATNPTETEFGSQLAQFIESAKVNFALLPPSVIRTFSPADVANLQTLVSIGEPMQTDAEVGRVWAGALRFFKAWGATETSMVSTALQIPAATEHCSANSIGTPVGCAAWIVSAHDANLLAPLGGVGELVIEGFGVASGYTGDNSKTAAAFLHTPAWATEYDFAQSCRRATRFFRTGELAKYNSDGTISYVGRVGNRVKLSGSQMVQLENVERAIMGCSQVREAATAGKIIAGRTQLVAVVCLAAPGLPRQTALQRLAGFDADTADRRMRGVRAYAESVLPADHVPTVWLAVEKLPRTASYEIDRVALTEWLKRLRN